MFPQSAAAPWRALFLSGLEKSSASPFTLSTIAHGTGSPKLAVPRARTVEFRGFFPKPASSLHPSAIDALKAQNIGLNPEVYESDVFSITTDVRMGKVGQIGGSTSDEGGTGDRAGEEAVEAVFWFEKGVKTQWRVRGRGVTIGSAKEEDKERERRVRERIFKRMRLCDGVDKDSKEMKEWEWERQVTTYFASHTPAMRGSYKNPTPGTPRSQTPSNPEWRLNQKVEDLRDPVARENFRVLLILPDEVERLDLSNPEDVRRTNWAFVEDGDGGKWQETELWP
ncbi:pyridoxamine 5'-phosphate oxidase-domain-containing protein [Aspergillus granulosus]|uniref:Pyridoxamine 5'-phosphate oxidase-domain-containing protein n=1 Tax=Aspergillus granulosus TaxID=176169 RepID=A0ABR4GWM0_9EURO